MEVLMVSLYNKRGQHIVTYFCHFFSMKMEEEWKQAMRGKIYCGGGGNEFSFLSSEPNLMQKMFRRNPKSR
jgi:hypothetical protein